MSRKQRQPEAAIQRAVIEHLRRRGVSNSFAFHPANGGWRTAVEGAILKGMGVVPGVPDVIIIHNGKAFGLELKPVTAVLPTFSARHLKPCTAPAPPLPSFMASMKRSHNSKLGDSSPQPEFAHRANKRRPYARQITWKEIAP